MTRRPAVGQGGVRVVLAAAALALAVVAPAAAAEDDVRFELTPLVGFRVGGSFEVEDSGDDLDLDEGSSYSLLLGFPLDESSVIEVELSHMATELQDGGLFSGEPLFDLDVDSILAGGRYQGRGDRVRGFVAGGVGVTRFSPDGPGFSSEYGFTLSVGGGGLIRLGGHVALRLEGRGLLHILTDETRVFCDSDTCQVYIEGQGLLQGEVRVGVSFGF